MIRLSINPRTRTTVIETIADLGGSASASVIARRRGCHGALPTTCSVHDPLVIFSRMAAQPYKHPRLFKLTGRAWTQGQLAEYRFRLSMN